MTLRMVKISPVWFQSKASLLGHLFHDTYRPDTHEVCVCVCHAEGPLQSKMHARISSTGCGPQRLRKESARARGSGSHLD